MDTILYFYRKRNLSEPLIEIAKMPGYRLIRVAVAVEGESWFGQSLGQEIPESLAEELEPGRPEESGLFARLRNRRLERKRRQQARRRLEEQLAQREKRIRAAEGQMDALSAYLAAKADLGGEAGYVCEEGLESCGAWSAWTRRFPVGKFEGWKRRFWVEQLLCGARFPRLIILGGCEEIREIIEGRARGLKAVTWFLKEEDYPGDPQALAEDFYIEYGLAISLRLLYGRDAYRRLKLSCPEPADILDFTGEARVDTSGTARGSVWLDAASLEQKRRRIQGRDTGIVYDSLRERWRRTSAPGPERAGTGSVSAGER